MSLNIEVDEDEVARVTIAYFDFHFYLLAFKVINIASTYV
jgi:hypothetical protein